MDCFICKTPLTLGSMSKHFKLLHDLAEKDTYRCTFANNCNQYLNSFSSFSRHFKSHLRSELSSKTINIENVSVSPQSTVDINPSVGSDSELSQTASSSQVSENLNRFPSSTLVHFNEPILPSLVTPSFTESGISLALQLHNNNNFTRKDVLAIQNNVMQNIIQPMLHQFQSFIQNNVPLEIEQALALSSMVQAIENPFQNLLTINCINGLEQTIMRAI